MAKRRSRPATAPRRDGVPPAPRSGPTPAEPAAPRRPAPWLLLAAALAVVALWSALRLAAPQPWSYDEYYHLAVARELRAQPLLRSFPWTPHSILAEHWADKEPLFHYALAPFASQPLERAGFLASLLGQVLLVGSFAFALWRLRAPWAPLLVLALAGLGTMTTLRAEMARPHAWVMAACFLAVGLVVGRARVAVLFVVAALAGLAHAGGWLVAAFAALWVALDRLHPAGRPTPGAWRVAAAAGAGWLAGQLVHPQVPYNFRLLWLQNVVVPLQSTGGDETLRSQLGTELTPPPPEVLAAQWPALLAAGILIALVVTTPKAATRDALTAAVPALGFLAVGTFLMQRFFELGAPLCLLALGLVLRERQALAQPARRPLRVAAAVAAVVVAVGWTVLLTLQLGFGRHSPPRAMAEWLGHNGTPGERAFTAQWADSAPLLWSAPQLQSLVALDPTFFYSHDPALFATYVNVVSGKHPDPARVIRERFGARWVTLWKPGYPQLGRRLLAARGVVVTFDDPEYMVLDLGRSVGAPAAPPAVGR